MIKKFLVACGVSYAVMFVDPAQATNRLPLLRCGVADQVSVAPTVRINSGLLPATNPRDFFAYNFGVVSGPEVGMNEATPWIPESAKLTLLGVGLVCLALVWRKNPIRKDLSAGNTDVRK
jgi:hypothetical protein